jgi:hypothetical protein
MTDKSTRRTPPETPEDWAYLWQGAERGHDAWPVTGPMVAAVRNWKAWVFALALVLWINRPDILAALNTLIGGR